VTNNLEQRLRQHREGLVPGFTSPYRIFRLVHYKVFGDIRLAIAREKEIKSWRRAEFKRPQARRERRREKEQIPRRPGSRASRAGTPSE
jgi:predicted GIY-YIG superfamily endonuclease